MISAYIATIKATTCHHVSNNKLWTFATAGALLGSVVAFRSFVDDPIFMLHMFDMFDIAVVLYLVWKL